MVSVTLRPRFSPGERTTGTHCTGGWVGPRAGLDTEDRGKILCLCRGSNPDCPVVQPVVRHYTDWAKPAHWQCFQSSEMSARRISWTDLRITISMQASVIRVEKRTHRYTTQCDISGFHGGEHEDQNYYPNDGGSTHLWNVGLVQRSARRYITEGCLLDTQY
jgi:hypothetical protein